MWANIMKQYEKLITECMNGIDTSVSPRELALKFQSMGIPEEFFKKGSYISRALCEIYAGPSESIEKGMEKATFPHLHYSMTESFNLNEN